MTKHYIGATKKSRASSSKKSIPKLPNLGTLAVGSLLGVLLTSGVFYMFSTSDITLKIPTSATITKVETKITEDSLVVKKDEQPPEPRFDFYTELTNNSQETNQSVPIINETPKPVATANPVHPPAAAIPTGTPQPLIQRSDLKSKTKTINAYLIQAGSFKTRAEADSLRATLTLNAQDAKIETAKLPNGDTWHRVMLGPFSTEKGARALQELLKGYDINGILVVKYIEH